MLFLTCHPRLCLWRTWENISLQLSPQQTEECLRQAECFSKLCSRYVGIHFPVGHQEGDSSCFESSHHSYPNQDWWELLAGIGKLWLQCTWQEWMWGGAKKRTRNQVMLNICFMFDFFRFFHLFVSCLASLVSFFTLQFFLQTRNSKYIGENSFVKVTNLIMVRWWSSFQIRSETAPESFGKAP